MTPAELYAVVEGTWPPAARRRLGPWTIRDGQGGGKRVSAATAEEVVSAADLPQATAAMRALDQTPTFMIRAGQDALDTLLADAGYRIVDPVNIYTAPVTALSDPAPPRLSTFTIWDPLAVMREIWAEGGIGQARVQVMQRAPGPRTGLFARHDNHPAAAAFVAIHAGCAMVHALEVRARFRGQGVGRLMIRRAALWSQAQGADTLAVVCTQANTGANALYTSLGMALVGQYHYRLKDTPDD